MDYSYPLLCSCERNGDRLALVGRTGEPITYRALEERIAGLAAGLRGMDLATRRVASIMNNEPEVVELYMALARIGAVSVPVNTRLNEAEKRYILEDAGVTAIVAGAEFLDEAHRLANSIATVETVVSANSGRSGGPSLEVLRGASPECPPTSTMTDELAIASITYTSGTTGFPKGVARSHRANTWNAVNSALGSPRSRHDVELFNLPAFGIGFLHFAMPALLGGATVVFDGTFHAERAWQLLQDHRVTRTFLAPTMISSMLAVPDQERFDIGALQMIYTAYAFPDRLRHQALERFGQRFVYMYGLTEAQLTCGELEEFAAKPTSVGRSMGVSRVGVFDSERRRLAAEQVGEIGFEGPSVMSSYHGLPEATSEALQNGWLMTGDLGRVDAAGDLHYVGRTKEMIKTGGFSVDPVEVENAILTMAKVDEAAVLGVEDDHWGESVIAFVAPAPGSELSSDAIIDTCKDLIAGYKVPKRVVFTDVLPKNATGKIDRRALRSLLAERVVHTDGSPAETPRAPKRPQLPG